MSNKNSWSHNICWDCFRKQLVAEGKDTDPSKYVSPTRRFLDQVCCYCGRHNREDLWKREDPAKVPCGGVHSQK